ncbi:hypothetical protein ACFLZZ_00555 [Nanoarchaeota archaeon]
MVTETIPIEERMLRLAREQPKYKVKVRYHSSIEKVIGTIPTTPGPTDFWAIAFYKPKPSYLYEKSDPHSKTIDFNRHTKYMAERIIKEHIDRKTSVLILRSKKQYGFFTGRAMSLLKEGDYEIQEARLNYDWCNNSEKENVSFINLKLNGNMTFLDSRLYLRYPLQNFLAPISSWLTPPPAQKVPLN